MKLIMIPFYVYCMCKQTIAYLVEMNKKSESRGLTLKFELYGTSIIHIDFYLSP